MNPANPAPKSLKMHRFAVMTPKIGLNAPSTHAFACMGPPCFGREAQKPGSSPNLKNGGEA